MSHSRIGASHTGRFVAVALAFLVIVAPCLAHAQSWQQLGGASSGGACYYSDQACAEGFTEMSGTFHSGGTAHNICCAVKSVAEDTVVSSSSGFANIANQFAGTSPGTHTQIAQVAGITTAEVSISGDASPEYRICNDSSCTDIASSWGNATQTISNSQYIQARNASVAPGNTPNQTTLTVGDSSTSWLTYGDVQDSFGPGPPGKPYVTSTVEYRSDTSGTVEIPSTDDPTGISFRICNDSACSDVVTSGWVASNNSASIDPGQYVQVAVAVPGQDHTDAFAVDGSHQDVQATHDGTKYEVFLGEKTNGAHWSTCEVWDNGTVQGTFEEWVATDNWEPADSDYLKGQTNNSVGWMLPDGTSIADSWDDLTDGNIDNPITMDATGSGGLTGDVWTNTGTDGRDDYGPHCNYWGDDTSSYDGKIGHAGDTSSTWTDTGNQIACNNNAYVYCFEENPVRAGRIYSK